MTVFNEYAQMVTKNLASVMGEMSFIDLESSDKVLPSDKVSHILRLDYTYPERGAFFLFLPYELKELFVENIYGEDWKKLTSQQIDDSLLEVLNIFAGRFLTDYYGQNQKYNMTIPSLVYDEEELLFHGESFDFYFTAEGNPIRLTWVRE
jgi:chemotaxis protein CheY-P-specific phosphatase CheC